MKLLELMNTVPEELASKQHLALKNHALSVLLKVVSLIKVEKYSEVEALLETSHAGDDMGEDNTFIDFCYGGEEEDIGQVISRLKKLKKVKKE